LINVPVQTSAPTTIDVTQELVDSAAASASRFQIEALFPKVTTNGNNIAQYVQWSNAVLNVTYSDSAPVAPQGYR